MDQRGANHYAEICSSAVHLAPRHVHHPSHAHVLEERLSLAPKGSLGALLLDFRSSLGRSLELGDTGQNGDFNQDFDQFLRQLNSDDAKNLDKELESLAPSLYAHFASGGGINLEVPAPVSEGGTKPVPSNSPPELLAIAGRPMAPPPPRPHAHMTQTTINSCTPNPQQQSGPQRIQQGGENACHLAPGSLTHEAAASMQQVQCSSLQAKLRQLEQQLQSATQMLQKMQQEQTLTLQLLDALQRAPPAEAIKLLQSLKLPQLGQQAHSKGHAQQRPPLSHAKPEQPSAAAQAQGAMQLEDSPEQLQAVPEKAVAAVAAAAAAARSKQQDKAKPAVPSSPVPHIAALTGLPGSPYSGPYPPPLFAHHKYMYDLWRLQPMHPMYGIPAPPAEDEETDRSGEEEEEQPEPQLSPQLPKGPRLARTASAGQLWHGPGGFGWPGLFPPWCPPGAAGMPFPYPYPHHAAWSPVSGKEPQKHKHKRKRTLDNQNVADHVVHSASKQQSPWVEVSPRGNHVSQQQQAAAVAQQQQQDESLLPSPFTKQQSFVLQSIGSLPTFPSQDQEQRETAGQKEQEQQRPSAPQPPPQQQQQQQHGSAPDASSPAGQCLPRSSILDTLAGSLNLNQASSVHLILKLLETVTSRKDVTDKQAAEQQQHHHKEAVAQQQQQQQQQQRQDQAGCMSLSSSQHYYQHSLHKHTQEHSPDDSTPNASTEPYNESTPFQNMLFAAAAAAGLHISPSSTLSAPIACLDNALTPTTTGSRQIASNAAAAPAAATIPALSGDQRQPPCRRKSYQGSAAHMVGHPEHHMLPGGSPVQYSTWPSHVYTPPLYPRDPLAMAGPPPSPQPALPTLLERRMQLAQDRNSAGVVAATPDAAGGGQPQPKAQLQTASSQNNLRQLSAPKKCSVSTQSSSGCSSGRPSRKTTPAGSQASAQGLHSSLHVSKHALPYLEPGAHGAGTDRSMWRAPVVPVQHGVLDIALPAAVPGYAQHFHAPPMESPPVHTTARSQQLSPVVHAAPDDCLPPQPQTGSGGKKKKRRLAVQDHPMLPYSMPNMPGHLPYGFPHPMMLHQHQQLFGRPLSPMPPAATTPHSHGASQGHVPAYRNSGTNLGSGSGQGSHRTPPPRRPSGTEGEPAEPKKTREGKALSPLAAAHVAAHGMQEQRPPCLGQHYGYKCLGCAGCKE